MAEYILAFNRGNGIERWCEPFASTEAAVSEAAGLLEYGNAWWFQVEQGDTIVMDEEAVKNAIVDLWAAEDDE